MFSQSSASLTTALKLPSVWVLEPIPQMSRVAPAPSRPPEAGAQLALGGTDVSALKRSLREVRVTDQRAGSLHSSAGSARIVTSVNCLSLMTEPSCPVSVTPSILETIKTRAWKVN